MGVAKPMVVIPAAAVLLALWSLRAGSMMGGEGPPPCDSQACFVDAVAACESGTAYMTRSAAGATAQYQVEGATEDGRCRLALIYITHPEPAWREKPLFFAVDPGGDIGAQLEQAVEGCLTGDANSEFQCDGPLLDVTEDR
ncbi:hypothetical protein [Spectribacter hydrogenoxidans]|uniref:Uncharacterized protein n=1 Tax=Spectribacter hydrogenoxidans TaxID=3075608 RepID=A0ABU3BZT8_9GAMM|nr:hypothetical protein [Salinisphaera sp. W335]MDT0634626.1 hypothetical protein [Salinisphaera sp. W335]